MSHTHWNNNYTNVTHQSDINCSKLLANCIELLNKESTKKKLQKFIAFLFFAGTIAFGLRYFLSPTCHYKPSSPGPIPDSSTNVPTPYPRDMEYGSALVVYKFRQPTFEEALSICNEKESRFGGKVVSIVDYYDFDHSDFIQKVRIHSFT